MFGTTYALRRLAMAAALTGSILLFAAATALAGGTSRYGTHDSWYANAVGANQGVTFVTDTLAPGGTSQGQGVQFVTDTLAPGGAPQGGQGIHFVTDTLAPGGGSTAPVATSSPGFSWWSAGAGAGIAAAALLLILTGTVAARRRAQPAV